MKDEKKVETTESFRPKKVSKKVKVVTAKKAIKIVWPGGRFECKKGDVVELDKLSKKVRSIVEDNNLI